jgi:hypothetical protein
MGATCEAGTAYPSGATEFIFAVRTALFFVNYSVGMHIVVRLIKYTLKRLIKEEFEDTKMGNGTKFRFRARLCELQKGCTRLAAACDKVYQLLPHGRWFSPGIPAFSTTNTGRINRGFLIFADFVVHLNYKNINPTKYNDTIDCCLYCLKPPYCCSI